MNDQQIPQAHMESATHLLQVQILQRLRDLEGDRLGEVLCRLERIEALVIRSTRAELDKIDQESNEIAAQLEARLSKVPPELQAYMEQHIAWLSALGKPISPPPTNT